MSLEKKRKTLELGRVQQARAEIEFSIEEKQAEIERLKAHIEIQKETEAKIKKELETL